MTGQITMTATNGLREGDVLTMPVRLRGWRRFVAWLLGRPLTKTETFVVREIVTADDL